MTVSGAPALVVLVVDDNRTAAEAVALLLRRDGHRVEVCFDGGTAIDRLREGGFDLVLTDLRMDPVDGLAVVKAARAAEPPVDAIVFTAFGSVESAVEAMRLGALDFLTKPVTADQILNRVRNIHAPPAAQADIVGESAASARIRDQARRLARVRSTVLVTGETGTGRRHLARWLHHNGLDADKPLVVAQPNQGLSEDQLAGAGTLLIPGVDDWTPVGQADLLRRLEMLEAGQPPRVIATASHAVDVAAARGEMAPELYFRLAVLVVRIPPLRERPADLGPLLDHFLQQHAQVFQKEVPRPSPEQVGRLASHGWPGNVREVSNLGERAVVLGPGAFDMNVKPAAPGPGPVPRLEEGFNLTEHLEEIERLLLVRAMEQTGGDRPAMGRLLGLERNTLRYKMNKHGLLDRT